MSERAPPHPLAPAALGLAGAQDPAGEPPAALVGLVENHPHHAALLWGRELRCLALSRPLRRYFGEIQGCDPAQAGQLLESTLHEHARRVLHAGSGEVLSARLFGQVLEGVQLCPAGLGGVVLLLPALPGLDAHRRPTREPATLRSILDALPLPTVVAFGPRGQERMLNVAAREMLGSGARDESADESLFSIEARWGKRRGDGSPLPEEARPLRRALQRGETVLGVEVSFALYGEGEIEERRVYLESAAPIFGSIFGSGGQGPGGELLGAVAVFQEITEQKRADRRKDQFLAMAGHELRTPLTVLRTQTQLISRWLDELPAEQVREVAEGIDLQTERLSLLVDDLLDVGRLVTGNVEIRAQPIDLSHLTRDLVTRAGGATSQYHFGVETPREEVWIEGDALRIEQVIENLLAHAQRRSPPGRQISVRVVRDVAGGAGEVSVHDQGPEVTPGDRERIFERFHQPERASRAEPAGLGLRLWISRKLVELMGGRIWVESEGVGTGAAFIFQLPLCSPGPREEAP